MADKRIAQIPVYNVDVLAGRGEVADKEEIIILTTYEGRLNHPRKWRSPSRIFVNSMSDLFHDEVPLEFLQKVFKVMNETPKQIYQVLTKRHKRLVEFADRLTWSPNIWESR